MRSIRSIAGELTEADIQAQVIDYVKPLESSGGFLVFAVINEGQGHTMGSGFARIARFKRMGMRSGVADLVFVKNGRCYFLEMKRNKGKQSENQKLFEADASRCQAPYAIARSFVAYVWWYGFIVGVVS